MGEFIIMMRIANEHIKRNGVFVPMNERKSKELENEKEEVVDLFSFDDFNEEVFIDYVCVDCGCLDPVPEFIVGECSYELEPGESPVFVCPECNGDLVRKKESAEE